MSTVATLARIRVVLLAPRDPGNVGAAARALKNMGLARLVVAGAPDLDLAAARRRAVHADDVLAAARTVATFAEAVADCGLVVGTTGRARAAERGSAAPRALAPVILAAAAANEVALVFGPEDRGLSRDELARCDRLLTVPTSDAYASLNLAQAVMLVAYELFLAAAAPPAAPAPALAPSAARERMFANLEAALRAIGYLHRDNAEHMMRALRRLLGRAALEDEDVRILLGIARQIAWFGGREPF